MSAKELLMYKILNFKVQLTPSENHEEGVRVPSVTVYNLSLKVKNFHIGRVVRYQHLYMVVFKYLKTY